MRAYIHALGLFMIASALSVPSPASSQPTSLPSPFCVHWPVIDSNGVAVVKTDCASSAVPVVTPTTPAPSASPSSAPTATASPLPTTTPTVAPTPQPTAAPGRMLIWKIGDPATTSCEGCNGVSIAQIDAANDLVRFHIQRPTSTTVEPIPSGTYRSYIMLFNVLKTNGQYSIVFQTDDTLLDKGLHSRNHIEAIHDSGGGVATMAFGTWNETSTDGSGTAYWVSSPKGYYTVPGYVRGASSRWEIQQKVAADSSGWYRLYRNGSLVYSYDGPNVNNSTSLRLDFGIYEWLWEQGAGWSTDTVEDLTMHHIKVYSIGGPLAPL